METTKETTEKDIISYLEVAASAAKTDEKLPTGDVLEKQILDQQGPAPAKKGPGRPRKTPGEPKAERKEETPAPSSQDIRSANPITQLWNGGLIPALSNMGIPFIDPGVHKEPQKVMFTPEQTEMINSLCPQEDWMKPSWALYFVSLIGVTLTNWFMAPATNTKQRFDELEKQIEELKKQAANPLNARQVPPVKNDEANEGK